MTETNVYAYVEAAAISDMGCVRGNNEDSFLCAPEAGCFAVADGMGGGDAGEVASATVVECLKKAVESTALDSPGCRKYAIQQSLHKANGTVVKYRDSHGFKSMGSTVVVGQSRVLEGQPSRPLQPIDPTQVELTLSPQCLF